MTPSLGLVARLIRERRTTRPLAESDARRRLYPTYSGLMRQLNNETRLRALEASEARELQRSTTADESIR